MTTDAPGRGATPAAARPRTFDEVMLLAGLPVPIYPEGAEKDPRRYDAAIGTLTGRIVADLALAAAGLGPVATIALVRAEVRERVRGKELGRLDRARSRVGGLVDQYLLEFSPAVDAALLGAEHTFPGRGRADLVWDHDTLGVFVDEIKTVRHLPRGGFDGETQEQVTRYVAGGTEQWGDLFAGVRLINLGYRASNLAFLPDGSVVPLERSPLAPAALGRTRAAA